MKNSVTIFWLAILAIIVIGVGASFYVGAKPGKYDTFAQCLTQKGVIFYGAFWCPHCQATKRMFGSSARLLPYHECSTPDGKGQLQACTDAQVQSYPTWVFPDGNRLTGEHTLEEISTASGCPLSA
jgi:thiol-disulfide isomerase/thioredoxin